ncbi:MAG: thioredoxin domain-containing protein, partial [Clostridiales bacterium]|nr:thioredoxin domain-containing protein [Clostridiales bacterium]
VDLLKEHSTPANAAAVPEKSLLLSAVSSFKSIYDTKWGGFGAAPKFPTPHNFLFLLRYFLGEQDSCALQIVTHTLKQMFRGGIFDHLGGGFSRYSTDEKWLVPHFEKMLYDNALLSLAYLEAYHITNQSFYRRVTESTLDYVLRELTDSNGGFYCGQDADSEGIEGKYYVFTQQEIFRVLGRQDGAVFCSWFGITKEGNFEGKNVLNLLGNPQYSETPSNIRSLSDKLYSYRLNRTYLHKDDKILTSWNALMIAALAKAGQMLGKSVYMQSAKKAQSFLEGALTDESGRIKLRWREGESAHAGQLDDYAFYAYALLELYQSTYEVKYLQKAIIISEQMLNQFWDEVQGGFFLYSKENEQLISRPKEVYDGAIPSGNSVAAVVLERLARLTGEIKWQQVSYHQLSFLAGAIQDYPAGHSMALIAISGVAYETGELVCVTSERGVPEELLSFLNKNIMPNLTVLLKNNENKDELKKAAPFTESFPIPENGTLFYLCRNGTCSLPFNDISTLISH